MGIIKEDNLNIIRGSLFKIADEIKKDRNDLYKKIIDICEEIGGMFSDTDDYEWPMSKMDFCDNFELNRNTVNRHIDINLKDGIDYFIEGNGPHRVFFLKKHGALEILRHCRSEKAARYLRKHGSSIVSKEEHYYINIIKYAVKGFDISKKHFNVKTENGDFFIDLYFKNANLAIECDEHGHYDQEYLDEMLRREKDIVNKLGCRFLRFNPHELDFNVGEVINAIFHLIFNKLIDGKDPISHYLEDRKDRKRSIRRRISLDDVPDLEFDLELD